MSRRPKVRVFPDLTSMSLAAADFIARLAREDATLRGRFAVALSGGSTPKQLYALLSSPPYRESIPWQNVHVFWADERCVPGSHPDSNYKLALDTFLSAVPIAAAAVHRIRGEDGPDTAARAYDEELRAFFGRSGFPKFDLVLLGAGADGHTASLFPGSPAVGEEKRLAVPVHASPRYNRVTLALPVLNSAEHVLFLAAGLDKAGVVHDIIEQGNPKRYPAGLVRPASSMVSWMVDRDAAALLTDTAAEEY